MLAAIETKMKATTWKSKKTESETGVKCDLEFRLRPFIEKSNSVPSNKMDELNSFPCE